MSYVIKITNKNIDYDVTPEVIDLSTISPTLITNPDIPYAEYASDVQNESTSVFIPLYKRSQYVELKAGSVLIIQTDDSDEAIYYRNIKLDNITILCDPDPISGGSSGPVLIEKTITENGVYNASDDEADGYSSVDVQVGGGASFPKYIAFTGPKNESTGTYEGEIIAYDEGGYYTLEGKESFYPYNFILATPAIEIRINPTRCFIVCTFSESFNYDFYAYIQNAGWQLLPGQCLSGDTITPGDGKLYTLTYSYSGAGYMPSLAIKKSSSNFVFNTYDS